MATAFRDTAIITDGTGRFRSSIILTARVDGKPAVWSDEAKASYCRNQARAVVAIELSDAEYERLEANGALRFGYVDKASDTDSPLVPCEWVSLY